MKYINCVVYDYVKDVLKVITMQSKYKKHEFFTLYCGYTGEERPYIFLGDL